MVNISSNDNTYTVNSIRSENYGVRLNKYFWFSPIQTSDFSNAFIMTKNDTTILFFNYTISDCVAIISLAIEEENAAEMFEALQMAIDELRRRKPELLSAIIYLLDENEEMYLKNNKYIFRQIGRYRKGIKVENECYELLVYYSFLKV